MFDAVVQVYQTTFALPELDEPGATQESQEDDAEEQAAEEAEKVAEAEAAARDFRTNLTTQFLSACLDANVAWCDQNVDCN